MNSTETRDDRDSYTPLWIHPLSTRSVEPGNQHDSIVESNAKGSYRVIQKLVTASPNRQLPDAEIETALEAFVTPNGECLWRRVAVWSGPSSPLKVIHASFVLPSNADMVVEDNLFSFGISQSQPQQQQMPSLLCWAAFPERPDHKLLCVLVNPSTLSIWDVYPDSDKVYVTGEGHSVSLPFQCCAIHPLGDSHGLLLQRKEDQEDLEAQRGNWTFPTHFSSSHAAANDEEEDGFFLKVPPQNTRMTEDGTTSRSRPSAGMPLMSPRSAAFGPTEVASLFSLKHPLEDVLPIMNSSPLTGEDDEPQVTSSLVTDAFEKILYTGVLRWTDHADNYLEKKHHEQPICVTYHGLRKRHAIWALKGAPVPPSTPPLWQRSRRWRSTRDWDSHIGLLDQDLEDMELLGVAPNGSVYESQTRDEALADALGVRRTPRRPVDGAPTRGGRGLEPRNRAEATTPANLSMYPQGPSRFVKDASYVDADASLIDTPHLLNLQPLSNLHPVVALECMYEEGGECSPANNVFLASNLEGSGLLVLCLVVPSVEGSTNPNVMKLFSLEPSLDEPLAAQEIDDENMYGTLSESLRHNFSIRPISTKSCLAAQPIQATPTPLRHLPYGNNRNNEAEMATDVLVLWKSDNEQTRISLHRSQTYILDCALCDGNSEGKHAVSYVTDIQNAVRGHVDFVRGNDVENCVSLRGNISLEIQSDALTEKILVAIEDFMFTKSEELSKLDFLEFALHLRGDCCRLEQKLNSDAAGFVARVGNKAWAAFETLFCHILDSELFGSNGKSHPRSVTENMDSTWARLLDSSFHASYFEDNFDSLFLGGTDSGLLSDKSESSHTKQDNLRRLMSSIGCHTSSTSVPGVSIIAGLFDTLHLVYEELKLSYDSNIADHLRSVSSPLIRTCFTVISAASNRNVESGEVSIMNNFLAHYSRGIGSRWVESIQADMNRRKKPICMDLTKTHVTSFNEPPCLMTWLDATLRNSDRRGFYDVDDISTINAGCRMTRSVLRIFSLLFCSEKQSQSERDYAVVSALCEEGFATAQEVRAKLPVGICVPILEALNRCRDDPELESFSGWTSAEFTLIGRPDLSMNNEKDSHKGAIRSTASEIVPVRVSDRDNPTFADKDKDGLVPLEVSSAMLFPEDNRIREAGRLLRSSRPCFLSVSRSVEVSDHDYERLKQNKLLLLCRRSLALPVGRGMVTIGTFQPVAAEPLPVPDLCLSGRIPPANTNLALDLSECQSDFKIWPEFHNGVAAGLRLPLGGDIEESITKITRTWIVYNRPTTAPENQPQNQGNQTPPPPKINSHAHGGLLLALGLRGHLSELEMTDLFDYLTQGQVTLTCGVLLGMAANKRGTCDISVSKMLCLHLPSLIPQHFSAIDVASPVQTAAVAGAGLLFQGSSHRMMTEFLLNEIGRRPESDVALDREAYTLSCGIALGMVNLCKGERIHDGQGSGLSDLRIGERLYRYIVGGTDEEEARRMREANDRLNLPPNSSTGDNERCSCVFEGNSINIDVTAAGATLALGLIFMKTGNANVASAIALPDTHFLLEYVRPDFLGLRVISKALILWDDVRPCREWIENQLPKVVRDAYKQMQAQIRKATDLGDMFDSEDRRSSAGSTVAQPSQEYDCQAVRQIYVHVIAGACFGIGLRFAGTANKQATAAIFERVIELQTLRDVSDSVSAAMRPEDQILDTCLGCCAISLALVNAGTGDLEALKIFKILRWRCDEQVKYGIHQCFGMAIGLLFLGGGSCTFGREPEDIAALVAAFYPRFPYSTTDNQYHLQALRHLYALAVKRRELRFVDVDTGENVHIPVEIDFKDQTESLRLDAPCILRNIDRPVLIARIVSDSFYSMKFDLNDVASGRTFFVKRKMESSCLGGASDLRRSLLVQTGNFNGVGFLDLMKSLSGNPYVLSFAKYMCGNGSHSRKKVRNASAVEGFCEFILHECLTADVEMSLPVYIGLWTSISSIDAGSSSASIYLWDFQLIRSYYEEHCRRQLATAGQPLLNFQKIAVLNELVESSVPLYS